MTGRRFAEAREALVLTTAPAEQNLNAATRRRSFAASAAIFLMVSVAACGSNAVSDAAPPPAAANALSAEDRPTPIASAPDSRESPTDTPGTTPAATRQADSSARGTPTSGSPGYEVQSGDTLSDVAARNGLSTAELAKLNDIENPDHIEVGRVLVVAQTTPDARAAVSAPPTERAATEIPTAPPSVTAGSPIEARSVASESPTDAPLAVGAPVTESPSAVESGLHPLSIEWLRGQTFSGSDITIEQTLPGGPGYARYIGSYLSEGLRIDGVLAVPTGAKPPTGWPVVILNHGYIQPPQYRSTARYVAFVDAIASSGYIAFMPDYRGHGDSEGVASGGYGSQAYVVDVLNAVASVKRFPDADAERIVMWGHSMGGQITLRAMVVSRDVKAGAIWAGVVAPYPVLLTDWALFRRGSAASEVSGHLGQGWRASLVRDFGSPDENPEFWAGISPNSYLDSVSGPIQLHHSTTDTHVPLAFSELLYDQLIEAEQRVDLFRYESDDHNIAKNFRLAADRTMAFFDEVLQSRT